MNPTTPSHSPHPRAAGAATPFLRVASGGHLSFNSERKVRKNATKTYGFGFPQRAMPCAKPALCSSRNRIFRVPLSVKRTVPPQLSAVASLPLPVATVGAFPFTAVPGYFHPNVAALVRTVIPNQSADWRGNPPPPKAPSGGALQIVTAQRAAPTPAAAGAAAGARFDNRPPHRERVSKGRGRTRPFPLDASRGRNF